MIDRADQRRDISAAFQDTEGVTQAIRLAGRDARLLHKQLGVPLVVWQNGQIVHIPPEEIVVDLPDSSEQRSE